MSEANPFKYGVLGAEPLGERGAGKTRETRFDAGGKHSPTKLFLRVKCSFAFPSHHQS
jgi:hypothetical protein